MTNQIDKLPGVIVEDITDTVEHYLTNLRTNPITNQHYTCDDITGIMCKFPELGWDLNADVHIDLMEIYLLKEIISDMRLDAIQYKLAFNDIESVSNTDVSGDNKVSLIAKICRDSGV